METIREFIEEAVLVYNAGKLTPRKLHEICNSYKTTFEDGYFKRCRDLDSTQSMLCTTFMEKKGEMITKKLNPKLSEDYNKLVQNPFYKPTD